MRLWQDTEQHHHSFPMEKWDDRLGMHTRDDGTLKPAGQVFLSLAVLMGHIAVQQFDPDTRTVITSLGRLIAHAGSEQAGDSALYHVDGPRCFAAMAKSAIVWEGRTLLTGPSDAFLFAQALDDADMATSRHLLLRCEAPGVLMLCRTAPVIARLIDWHPATPRVLTTLSPDCAPDGTVIHLTGEMCPYWVELCWA
jgi:hypothetical protein